MNAEKVFHRPISSSNLGSWSQNFRTVLVQESDYLLSLVDHFNGTILKPEIERVTSHARLLRFPPADKLSPQVLNKLHMAYRLTQPGLNLEGSFSFLFRALKCRDSLLFSGFRSLKEMWQGPTPFNETAEVHPKVLICAQLVQQYCSEGDRVIVVMSDVDVCHELRLELARIKVERSIAVDQFDETTGVLIFSNIKAFEICFNHDDHAIFHDSVSFFENQETIDAAAQIVNSIDVLLLDHHETSNFEKVMDANAYVITGCSTSLRPSKPPTLIGRHFDLTRNGRIGNGGNVSPRISFITESMIECAEYPELCNYDATISGVLVDHSELSKALEPFNTDGVVESADRRQERILENWVRANEQMLPMDHFFVPNSCYVEDACVAAKFARDSDQLGKVPPSLPVCEPKKRNRLVVIESSDASPIAAGNHKAVTRQLLKNAAYFVDCEAQVSGSNGGLSEELSEPYCSSMQDFIDDRSEVTMVSTQPSLANGSEISSSQATSDRTMTFYRQSLLSSQPSKFEQPARQFSRKLKVKLHVVNPDPNSIPRSDNEDHDSCLHDINWSDDVDV